MPKISKEMEIEKVNEIVNVCRELYKNKSFKDISIKDIGEKTSFTRTSIYNYFETKEEIFLSILKQEYDEFNKSLNEITDNKSIKTPSDLAKQIAKTMAEREMMLKLLALDINDIEKNSRFECLIELKKSFKQNLVLFKKALSKIDKNKMEIENITYIFFPMMYGLYPYANATTEQRRAMEQTGCDFKYMTIYELSLNALLKLLD